MFVLVGGLVFGVSMSAVARPWRVAQVPNGAIATCQTCHVFPGGPRNALGHTIEAYGGVGFLLNGDVQWDTRAIAETPGAPPRTLAQIDSDGDGRTNGEELLDPNGVWRTGQPNPGDPALVRSPAVPDAAVVIRQVYVSGGVLGASYQSDFVELYNRSNAVVAIDGWSLQWAPPTGSGNWGSGAAMLAVLPTPLILLPGQSYLVQGASGGVNGTPITAADLVTTLALGDTGGKLVLVNDSAPLACNGSPNTCTLTALAKIVDLVGYGNANTFEGVAAAVASGGSALSRVRNGCTDIDNNGVNAAFPEVPADSTLASPILRNSVSPRVVCGPQTVPAMTPDVRWLLALCLTGLAGLAWSRRNETMWRLRETRQARH